MKKDRVNFSIFQKYFIWFRLLSPASLFYRGEIPQPWRSLSSPFYLFLFPDPWRDKALISSLPSLTPFVFESDRTWKQLQVSIILNFKATSHAWIKPEVKHKAIIYSPQRFFSRKMFIFTDIQPSMWSWLRFKTFYWTGIKWQTMGKVEPIMCYVESKPFTSKHRTLFRTPLQRMCIRSYARSARFFTLYL